MGKQDESKFCVSGCSLNVDEVCRQLPKVELHAHLNGSLRDDTILELCRQQTGSDHAARDIINGDRDLTKVFKLFSLIQKLTNSAAIIERIAREVVEDFAAEGVRYVEVRSTPRANPETNMSKRSYAEAVLRGLQAGEASVSNSQIVARLLLSIDRRQTREEAMDTVEVALALADRGAVGIDLSGDPKAGDFQTFWEPLEHARAHGLKITLHFAEVYRPDESMAMLRFRPDRIGHANFLDADITAAMHGAPVPLEVCPTSNVLTGSVASYADHHFIDFWRANYPLCVCTDDKGVFKTSLSTEYQILARTFELGPEDLFKLALTPLEFIFAPADVKQALASRFAGDLQRLRSQL